MTRRFIYLLALSLIAIFWTSSCFRNVNTEFDLENKKVRKIIAAQSDTIELPKYFPDKDVRKYLYKEFNHFYKDRKYELAWVNFEEPLPQAHELLNNMDEADLEGLDPENYKVEEIETLIKSIYKIETKKEIRKHKRAKKSLNKKIAREAWEKDTLKLHQLVRLDFLLTSTYLTYASHLLAGKINPYEEELWFAKPRKRNLAEHLEKAITDKKISESLLAVLPKHPQYTLLKKQLHRLRSVEKMDTISEAPLSGNVKVSNSSAIPGSVIHKLQLYGDLSPEYKGDEGMLVAAIKRFQQRHGLTETGGISSETFARLNISVKERIEQVKVNLERMRWLPDNFGERYILVNIPEFKLRLYNENLVELQMRVIVGNNYKKTPVFSDTLESVVFSPTWTVPRDIVVEEFIPQLIKDPFYLEKKGFLLYDSWKENAEPLDGTAMKWHEVDTANFKYRIVQAPGEENPLGLVKFLLPNSEDIYLHDTPNDNLFNAKKRTFSHGCIRLEKPDKLALFLLKDKGWDEEKLREHLKPQEKPEYFNLSKKLPVHIVYWTSWVDENGALQFRDDIYLHDKKQEDLIKKKERTL